MGFGGRKPVLPAPTESLVDSGVEDTGVSTELATDISRRTDRTSATIPDDGSPVTISTGAKGKVSGNKSKSGNLSQTSLLIEYYEGQKESGTNRRPSLRVRVRPSTGKGKDKGQAKAEGYIAVTHEAGSRKPSYTQRIPLGSKSLDPAANSTISLDSTPLDIEIDGRGSDMSDMSPSPEPRFIAATSDISSMPPDSMLGTNSAVAPAPPPAATSSILTNSELDERSDLNYNMSSKERNPSRSKTAQRALERQGGHERASSKSLHSSEKSRSRSGSTSREARNMALQERTRKSGKLHPEESSVSGGTESLISNSVLSAGARSLDDKSVRSGNSNITNPKLLQTVEDAIRRLILPELKEIKRYGSQRNRHKEDTYSDLSDNSIAKEKAASRRVSSGSGSRRRVSKGSGSGSRRRHHHSRDAEYEYDSPSEASSHHGESVSSISADRDHRSRSGEKGVRGRDVAAGALAGGALTAAALHHQDSSSTLERRRRRKRSKSQSSRSASVAESEEHFEKPPAVPPMPFRSEIGSDLTRSSLLSSNTADTSTPTQREIRETVRGSPLDRGSPMETTPTQGPGDLRQTLGTHHRNFSGHDLNVHRNSYEEAAETQSTGDYSPESYHDHSFAFADPERLKAYERNLHQQHPIRRGLSPIQSVASYATTEPNRHSAMQTRSMDSISSLKRRQQLKEEVSVDSFASASPSVQQSGRPQGINLENRSEIMNQHDDSLIEHDREIDEFYDEQHDENDRYRQSYTSNDPKVDVRHLTNYTDDSMDATHFDKVGRGQQVIEGFSGRPEYVHTPPGVESAVASLIETSVLDIQPPQSPRQSVTGSVGQDNVSLHSASHNVRGVKSASPSKDQISVQSPNSYGKSRAIDTSPPQSPAHSPAASQQDVVHTKQTEDQSATSPESEITTNPSVIQGPIGGLSAGNRDHWPYGATPDRSMPNNPAQQALNRDLGVHAPDLIPEALNLSQRQPFDAKEDIYSGGEITPPGKDEGYATGDNPRSPGLYAKRNERAAQYTPDDLNLQDDPFVTKRNKYMSGLSQGMSPLYDSATGRGIDRIQSKDIVALMDHLTVRDAQRNARDTEILVTLVSSAAEMRNSFEDMKKFIEEQGGLITATAERQHEKTQRVIGGPRPQPISNRATQRSLVLQEEDTPAKRQNVFRRALQGLGSKNATELHKIETMLMQLLDDVEDLRTLHASTQQSATPTANAPLAESIGSVENTRAPTDTGYEPDGQAGTSSTGDRSGNLSNQSSRHEYRIVGGQRDSVNRVSTVLEGDEEEYDDDYDNHNSRDLNRNTALGSHQVEQQYRQSRGQSVPVATPPKMHDQMQGAWSNENTPRSIEPTSHRKNKSIASSLMPKFMSRWSKTTVSTEPRFSVQNKARPYSQVSHSGSDLGEYSYEPQQDDRLRSNTSLQEEYQDQENRPPSPLVPSQVSDNPKYQGYRNSKNLQHPQPRQGPTGRYQTQLENEAQNYYDQFSPTSQTSSHQWEVQQGTREANRMSQERHQTQQPLSTVSDGYSETSDRRSVASSRRHTKIMDDEPLVPQRPPKIPMSPVTYVDHVAAARSGSPAYDKSPVAALRSPQSFGRKPSGPRPYNGASQSGQEQTQGQHFRGDLNTVKKTRFRGSPYQISSNEDVAQSHEIGV